MRYRSTIPLAIGAIVLAAFGCAVPKTNTVTVHNSVATASHARVQPMPNNPGWVLLPRPDPVHLAKPARKRPEKKLVRAGRYSPTPVPPPVLAFYSCSAIMKLWDEEGGNPRAAYIAAEIAMAESGGNPSAISPTDDFGLWQINGSWGRLATLDPRANARSAIYISADGTNWSPWTTYQTGAYIGRC
jgi:Lysozyme like domain